jgi:hypothetical protein
VKDTKWFYERARGQYQDARSLLSVTARKKFDLEYPNKAPNKQLFVKTDLAKYLMVWDGEPHIVSLGAQKNFAKFAERIGKDWGKNADFYNERYFKHAVAKMIIFRFMEKEVLNQPWYDGGYRANIVAYGIAKYAFEVQRTGKAVDFDRVWNEQLVSKPLGDALMLCAERVNAVVSRPPVGSSNISEWAKQQACWQRVQDLKFEMPNGWVKALISASTKKDDERTAKKVQLIDNDLAAQTRVLEIGGPAWSEIRDWAMGRGLLSPDEVGILEACARIPKKMPSPLQCSRALIVLSRVQDEGCTIVK